MISTSALAVGSLLGALAGTLASASPLAAAFQTVSAEGWWSQDLHRLVALELRALRTFAFFTVGGAAVGALFPNHFARGGRFVRLAGCLTLLLVLAAESTRTAVVSSTHCEDNPNIVWIVLDALRADHLGCYGYPKDTSPFLDELAASSVRFEHALSQESYTLASVASYFTSTYPPLTDVLYDLPDIDVLQRRFLTVAEGLADVGYGTAAFVFNPHLQARFRFDQGFEVYDDEILPAVPLHSSEPHIHDLFDTAARIHRKVSRFLDQRAETGDERPLALYLHYRDIHGPYVPPPPYHDLFAPEDWNEAQRRVALRGSCRTKDQDAPPFIEDLEYRLAQYDGEIRYTDDALAELFKLLASHGLDLDNTLVVVTADHGEEFRDPHPDDPGSWTHGRTLYMEQVRVPLIVSLPDGERGLVVDQPVELMDVGPTLLEAAVCSTSAPPAAFQGRSLIPLLKGGDLRPRPVFSGGNHGRGLVLADDLSYYSFDEGTKFKESDHAHRPGPDYPYRRNAQLFDLASDPRQTLDLGPTRPDDVQRLRSILLQWLVTAEGAGSATEAMELDPETIEQLKALGYLGGEH